MVEDNAWRTLFGRLLIGAAIIAAVVGFALAGGAATYLKSHAATDSGRAEDSQNALRDGEPRSSDSSASVPGGLVTDPQGYADALDQLGPLPDPSKSGLGGPATDSEPYADATPSAQAEFVAKHEDSSKCGSSSDFYERIGETGLQLVSKDNNRETYTDGTHRMVVEVSPMEVCLVDIK